MNAFARGKTMNVFAGGTDYKWGEETMNVFAGGTDYKWGGGDYECVCREKTMNAFARGEDYECVCRRRKL